MKNYYRQGRNYELFIRKVYSCEKGKRHGADESLLISLFLNELIENNKNQRIPPERQFFKVKLYVEKALIKLTKYKKYNDSYNHFIPLLFKLDKVKSPECIAKVVNASLAKIIELDNKLYGSA